MSSLACCYTLLHYQGKIWIQRFHQYVIVAIHQAIDMTQPIVFHYGRFQIFLEYLPVSILQKNTSPGIPSGSHMIFCSWMFYSQWSFYKINIAQ